MPSLEASGQNLNGTENAKGICSKDDTRVNVLVRLMWDLKVPNSVQKQAGGHKHAYPDGNASFC